jgi:peptidoglycan/xylan/chitin deacetylase (PgdA/CDA1 family)
VGATTSPRGASSGPFRVALTFDAEHPDRPARRDTPERVLDRLAEFDVRAGFFIQGRWAEAYPATASRIAGDGHLVGNHSHYHVRMPLLSARGLRSDIALAEAAIVQATGVDPRPWFRCPFGAGAGDPRVQRFVRDAGYRHVGWQVAAVDWQPDRTAADVEETVVAGAIGHGDGCVVLLHGWPDQAEGALPGIVRRLRDAGATFVRLDELPSDRLPELETPGAMAAIDVPPSPA